MRSLYLLAILALYGLTLATLPSCTKKVITAAPAVPDSVYNDRLEFALQDNFSFSYYVYGLQLFGLADTLSHAGPFTVMAPENAGFTASQWGFYGTISYTNASNWPVNYSNDFIHYTILDGRYSLDSLPLGDNQQLPVPGGYHIYVSKYIQQGDTVTTVNGSSVVAADILASNGLVQALAGPINPEEAHSIIGYIRNDQSLSIFAAALQRVHADTLLAASGPYTVFAPTNDAFRQAAWLGKGVSTMDSILAADTAVLGPIVRNHIVAGRYFINDLSRADTAATDTLQLPALDESVFYFIYKPYPWSSPQPSFAGGSGSGQPAAIATVSEKPYMGDIPAGNGIIQKISQLLVP